MGLDEGKLTVIDSRTGQEYTLSIRNASVRAIELRQIREDPGEFGMLSYDPGYTNTAACKSRVAFIDGAKGILRYRGYPIEVLAAHCSYTEVAYLLLRGKLPTQHELEAWNQEILENSSVHNDLKKFMNGFLCDAHPMNVLVSHSRGAVDLPFRRQANREPQKPLSPAGAAIQQDPTIAAYVYRKSHGLPFPDPDRGFSYSENLIHLLWSGTSRQPGREEAKVLAKALDTLFVLHAEHEQNCSTSTLRQVASSNADPYLSVASAISALSGPLHGGANEAVLTMLDEIGSSRRIPDFMRQVKAGERRLMGFGHRVYKSYDPRARIVRQIASEVFEVTGRNTKIDLAMELERIALEDDYFVKRRLYPNVDFYSGIIYEAMGFPPEMFTVLFAIGRSAGWLAHWEEFMCDPERRIARPRQVYLGPGETELVPLDDRLGQPQGSSSSRTESSVFYSAAVPTEGARRTCPGSRVRHRLPLPRAYREAAACPRRP